MLGILSFPIIFFLLWKFFSFWQKKIWLFYAVFLMLYAGIVAGFYFTRLYWIFWYYPFPQWVQLIGLCIVVVSFVIVKLSELAIGKRTRLFYSLLKGEEIHLEIKGLYAVVRHPIYAIFPWSIFGTLLYTGQFALLPVMVIFMMFRGWHAKKEEQHLRKILIGDYDAYMKQVPNRFYPAIFKRRRK
jgi:protein-S-isoprenylcysteine O-methyltransferase Ste14